ncbi:hypothetical protein DFP72DRAFT_912860 [Ephemerocybe angulata]|uniref:G domain-containing protein n=1 Tax=Ephemerocybe angulata TaxID=980116 RepID=A0A8H6HN59_9AGAR|nr:hypothetical protein DFP72DRAFT_912860 [Tulosesus angulatus]
MRPELEPTSPQSPTSDTLDVDSGVVVLLMGHSGAGKSHFINVAAGQQIAPECHMLSGQNSNIQPFEVKIPGTTRSQHLRANSVFLVDTPGLNNFFRTDLDILREISDWISDHCGPNVKVGGILFLQDITIDRATEYEKAVIPWPVIHLSSPELVKRLLLATGKWDRDAQGHNNYYDTEEKLKRTPAWSRMINQGAQLCRFEGDTKSAWTVLNQLLDMEPQPIQLLQQNLTRIKERFQQQVKKQPKRKGLLNMLKGLLSRLFT